MNLEQIRSQIDLIDGKIIKLLNDRLSQAIMAKKFKTNIEDPQREQEVFNNLELENLRLGHSGVRSTFIRHYHRRRQTLAISRPTGNRFPGRTRRL